jgi:hypothetical protein
MEMVLQQYDGREVAWPCRRSANPPGARRNVTL